MRTAAIFGSYLGSYLGLGLILAWLAVPAKAGSLADYKASSGKFKIENGVRVYRVLSPKTQIYKKQKDTYITEFSYERGYKDGLATGLNAAPKKFTKSLKRRQTGRKRYNYGRRYSTSGYNPRFNRFRSNISYGRPAYIALSKKN